MAKKTIQQTWDSIPLTFEDRFLEKYLGIFLHKPEIAIVELVANSFDACASKVNIIWPSKTGGLFKIIDNGTGMTKEEFQNIWSRFDYDRVKNNGTKVCFPENFQGIRHVYGRNGKGRHSLFCFSDKYNVETWKDGQFSEFLVEKATGDIPIRITPNNFKEKPKNEHGTEISCKIERNHIEDEALRNLIGIKFISDPSSFNLYINGEKVQPFDFKDALKEDTLNFPNGESVKIYRFETLPGRLSRMHGIAWWVNGRLVGDLTWKRFGEIYLSGHTQEARKYTFVIQADILADEVKEDWTWFKDTPKANFVVEKVDEFIYMAIDDLLQDIRAFRKKTIVRENPELFRRLSGLSRERVGEFMNEIQRKCPTMSEKNLSNAIQTFVNLEVARSGFGLLEKLASLTSDNLDELDNILDKWNITEAKRVLDELEWRLRLIKQMNSLVINPDTKELKELHPLMENGLWIFGPEYEGSRYLSNKSLQTAMNKFFDGAMIETPRNRPDFLLLSNGDILDVFASDREDKDGKEIPGFDQIMIIELKRGDSLITIKEMDQARNYAIALKKSGSINDAKSIKCYVLGTRVDSDLDEMSVGKKGDSAAAPIVVLPTTYGALLQVAERRTFNLSKKIRKSKGIMSSGDKEIDDVLANQELKLEYKERAKIKS